MHITFAIAESVDLGIVSVCRSGRLSQLFLWNLKTDEFAAGQCLKGRSEIYDISPDGKYFSYYVETFHQPAKSYVAVAKPPYFTALAYFPTFHLGERDILFAAENELWVTTQEPGWWGNASKDPVIVPGCPFTICEAGGHMNRNNTEYEDTSRQRLLLATENMILARKTDSSDETVLIQFPEITFTSLPPPDWALEW